MTPHNSTGQDASVAVLQQQQSNLETSLRDLTRSVNEGFASMTAKMDRINELTTSIAAITTRQEAHSDGLQRAFSEIQSVNSALAPQLEDSARWREMQTRSVDERFEAVREVASAHASQNAKDLSAVHSQISWWRGAVIGAGLVLGTLIGVFGWLGGKYVTSTENNTEAIHKLQRQVDGLPYPVNRQE
jgi:predicted negative regulator of RcsB-dependent stress response